MRLVVVTALAALLLPSAALAAGPSYVAQGGLGVLSNNGRYRFIAVSTGGGTAIQRVAVHGGAVSGWATLDGEWGIPQPTMRPGQLEGLSHDGTRLVVGTVGLQTPTRFAVIDTRNLRVRDSFEIPGSFAYDAVSPDGKTLYLTQYVDRDNASRYVVRAYDLEHGGLLPGRIADKAQASWVMEGFATTRTTSGDGRFVYTLFMRSGGYPFVHALDTVRGVAHCIGLPWAASNQEPLMRVRMALTDDETKLAIDWKGGKRWLAVDTSTWRITHATTSSFPWRWLLGGVAAAILLTLSGGLWIRRRTAPPEEAVAAA
ncbi:MAG: hypothetical protein ACJ744_06175 [Gaiellaceae bacterium]|jgi:hypothetical protein